MTTLLYGIGTLAAATLTGLGLLHLAWAARGGGGSAAVIPTIGGRPTLAPTAGMTVAVAALLFAAALLILGRVNGWGDARGEWLCTGGTWAVATVFLIRAIGNRGTVGLFKRVHGTPFARWDTKLYTPLCLGMSLALFVVARG
jgi:hypothetical protein